MHDGKDVLEERRSDESGTDDQGNDSDYITTDNSGEQGCLRDRKTPSGKRYKMSTENENVGSEEDLDTIGRTQKLCKCNKRKRHDDGSDDKLKRRGRRAYFIEERIPGFDYIHVIDNCVVDLDYGERKREKLRIAQREHGNKSDIYCERRFYSWADLFYVPYTGTGSCLQDAGESKKEKRNDDKMGTGIVPIAHGVVHDMDRQMGYSLGEGIEEGQQKSRERPKIEYAAMCSTSYGNLKR